MAFIVSQGRSRLSLSRPHHALSEKLKDMNWSRRRGHPPELRRLPEDDHSRAGELVAPGGPASGSWDNTRDFSGYVLAGVFGAPVSVSALVSVPAAVRGSCGRAGLPGGARSGGGSTGRVPRLTGPVLLPGRCLCWSVVIRWAGTG